MLFKSLIPILAVLATPFFASAYPTGAGTCDVTQMAAGAHGASAQPNNGGADGYTITTSKTGNNYTLSVNGKNPIEGLLIYVFDAKGNRVGNFVNLNAQNWQLKTCGGTGGNTVTHTNSNTKNLPIKLSWGSGGPTTGKWVVKALVVQNLKNWNQLDDTTFDLATGNVAGTTTGNNTSSGTGSPSPSGTSGSSSSSGGGGYGSGAARPEALVGIMYTTYAFIALAVVFQNFLRV